jgi:NAD(P)-dependent dehydrogenase (short-subunit alcohol dehydrogenase family)
MQENNERVLAGKVAVVTGATRGAGRGIAGALGEAGATVYCTGRSIRGKSAMEGRPETIEDTAEMVTARGGKGIAVGIDHLDRDAVKAFFERIQAEQGGRLDILVNNVWGGDELTDWQKPFWEHSLDKGLLLLERAVNTHIIASYFAAPLMIAQGHGLIVSTIDGEGGPLYYNLAKHSIKRMVQIMAGDLRPHHVAVMALSPGFMRTEAVLDSVNATEAGWKASPDLAGTESPFYVGRALVALATATNRMDRSGTETSSGDLSDEFGFTDLDGSRPHWGRHCEATHTK